MIWDFVKDPDMGSSCDLKWPEKKQLRISKTGYILTEDQRT